MTTRSRSNKSWPGDLTPKGSATFTTVCHAGDQVFNTRACGGLQTTALSFHNLACLCPQLPLLLSLPLSLISLFLFLFFLLLFFSLASLSASLPAPVSHWLNLLCALASTLSPGQPCSLEILGKVDSAASVQTVIIVSCPSQECQSLLWFFFCLPVRSSIG